MFAKLILLPTLNRTTFVCCQHGWKELSCSECYEHKITKDDNDHAYICVHCGAYKILCDKTGETSSW